VGAGVIWTKGVIVFVSLVDESDPDRASDGRIERRSDIPDGMTVGPNAVHPTVGRRIAAVVLTVVGLMMMMIMMIMMTQLQLK
jgi:hypothetical protein